MDFFLCSPSELPAEHNDEDLKQSSDTLPNFVESSCSEQSESSASTPQTRPVSFPRAGSTSPSSICDRRKLSTGIATTTPARHPALQGRPVVALPDLNHTSTKVMMAAPRSAPPKAPRFAPDNGRPRPARLVAAAGKSTKAMGGSSVAPLPAAKPLLHRATSAPVVKDQARLVRIDPPPLRLDAWSEPAAETFQVRGPNYLTDKAKEPSQEAAFHLLTVDMVQAEQPIYTGLCAHPQQRIQQALKRERETGVQELPSFIFAVNLCVPGDKTYHQVSYFGVDNFDDILHPTTPFGRLMNKFIFGESDEFRNKTFKLIPRIVEGNFVVRKAVGSKPTILGRKINMHYIRGPNFFEIIVDIASDPVAQRIVKLVLGYTKTLVVDMMFLLEGADQAFLPERVFGGVRLKNIDLKQKDGSRCVERP